MDTVAPLHPTAITREVIAVLEGQEGEALLSASQESGKDVWGTARQRLDEKSLIQSSKFAWQCLAGLDVELLKHTAYGRPFTLLRGGTKTIACPVLLQASTLSNSNPDCTTAATLRWFSTRDMQQLSVAAPVRPAVRRLMLPSHLRRHVQELTADREHGAAELAAHVIDVFASLGCAGSPPLSATGDGEEELEVLRDFAFQLATCRPAMAAIANASAMLMAALEDAIMARADAFDMEPGMIRLALADACVALRSLLSSAGQELEARVAALLRPGCRVVTHSFSSAVVRGAGLAAASMLPGGADAACAAPLHVAVSESRPLMEGLRAAAALRNAGAQVTLVTDAQAAHWTARADVALIGADAITPDGVVNKVGSYALALAARAAGVPIYAVATSLKVAPGSVLGQLLGPGPWLAGAELLEEKEEEEVTGAWPQGWGGLWDGPGPPARVSNLYFEAVPLELLAGVVTERGVLSQDEVRALMEQRGDMYRAVFPAGGVLEAGQ